MSYAAKYLKAHGQLCTIERTPAIQSYISMKRSTRAVRDLGSREGYWEGLILADSNLESGEVFSVGNDKFIVQTVTPYAASGELVWFAAKANAFLTHQRYVEVVDSNGNITQTWETLAENIPAFGEVVTYELRQRDPGLLDSTRYIFQIQKNLGVELLDRFVHLGENYQVNSIDDIALAGIARIQLGSDVRP